jgi:hypothetical protein
MMTPIYNISLAIISLVTPISLVNFIYSDIVINFTIYYTIEMPNIYHNLTIDICIYI